MMKSKFVSCCRTAVSEQRHYDRRSEVTAVYYFQRGWHDNLLYYYTVWIRDRYTHGQAKRLLTEHQLQLAACLL